MMTEHYRTRPEVQDADNSELFGVQELSVWTAIALVTFNKPNDQN
jgi:hypothetical protein